jgi:hypothetical protein
MAPVRYARLAAALVVVAVALTVGVVLDDTSTVGDDLSEPSVTGPTVTDGSSVPNGGDTPIVPGDYAEGRPTEFLPAFEPYDYAKDAPPREPTELDGTYMRIVSIDDAGGAEHAIPIHCLRCVPYSVDAGVQTLTLFEGRYFLEHQTDGFRALGHFVVDGDRIEVFNDVNCSTVRGRYAWRVRRSELTFELLDDPCPYEDERSNDMTFGPWTKVDLCTSGVERWYPAFLGC